MTTNDPILLSDLISNLSLPGQIDVIPLSTHVMGGLSFIVFRSRPTVGFLVSTKIGHRETDTPEVTAGFSFSLKSGGKCQPILFANLAPLFSGNSPGCDYTLNEITRVCKENGIEIVCAGKLSHGPETVIKRDQITFYDGHEYRPFYTSFPDESLDAQIIDLHQIIIPTTAVA